MNRQSDTCLSALKKFGLGCRLIFLSFNEKKIELLGYFGASVSASLDLGSLAHFLKLIATNLGIKIDATLKLDSQIIAVVKLSFFHLRQLTKIRPILP